jgi:hypothetical protein
MNFNQFKKLFQENFEKMSKEADILFEVDLNKDEMWNLYLDSFPAGTNEIYRQRREYDCSCCRHFIKSIGNAVTITNNGVRTIWDFATGDSTFQPVIDALSQYVKSKSVSDVHFSKFNKIGTDKNFDNTTGAVVEWQHFYLELPNKFVDNSGKSEGDFKGSYRDVRNVFKRSLEEISEESVSTVLELIAQNSLYKGEEWNSALLTFLKLKKEYSKLKTEKEKDNFAWEKSVKVGGAIGKIKNHSIGTLLVDITEGTDLDVAVKKYEVIVAPTNYKRPKAIFTQKMLEDAKKSIQNLGYLESLNRRYARLDDITVNNILFSNKDAAKRIVGANVFDEMMGDASLSPKKFSKVEEVPVADFVVNVLPTTKEIEVYLENKHSGNFVSLIAPENKDAPSMFKWGNAFSWAYAGNITDSDIKANVKSAGGNVEGVLRFSIQWNDGKDHDQNDLDAHCSEPNRNEIYYANKVDRNTTGALDVDIIYPTKNVPAVENITWSNKSRMALGVYTFYVYGFSNRGGRSGFKAEIEFDGQRFSFEYNKEVRQNEKIQVAEVTLNKDGVFIIKESLPSSVSSKDVWNLKTNQFVPVSIVMYSPNYWDEQNGNGNRHYFFMLKDCVNPELPNGFYNEFLKEDLLQHKRVFEALGGKMAVKDVDDQLSGLGFSSTKRNELIVKVKNQSERIIKIKF